MDELRAINDRINEKGYASKKDADRHLAISKKYQVCNTCKRPYQKIRMGRMAHIPGYGDREYEFCFSPTCIQCEIESWMMDPDINLDLGTE